MSHFNELQEAISKVDLEVWLDREGIDYRKSHGSSGEQINIKECPSCGNSNWKVYFGAHSSLGNCFVCDTKFNLFKFVSAQTGLNGRKTAAHIFQVSKEMGWRPPRKSTTKVIMDVKDLKLPHSYALPIKGKNLPYLENRGIGSDIAEYMHLRYCHKGLFGYVDSYGNKKYQDFSKRIIIPVFDLDGKIVSFQGRDITGTAEKKYLFPNGFASTGTILYNGHNVHDTERILVGEGVFDVAALKIAIDRDCDLRDAVPVGTFGKHLSFGHDDSQLAKFMELQKRGVKEVTFFWDGEIKATDDAIEAGKMLRNVGFRVRIAMLPDGRDPNEISSDVVSSAYWKAMVLDSTSILKIKMMRRAA